MCKSTFGQKYIWELHSLWIDFLYITYKNDMIL